MGQVQSALYSVCGGKSPSPDDFCVVHQGLIEGGRMVSLHCGHSFCLQPCFALILRSDHTDCPTCRTPLVLTSPSLDFLRLTLRTLTPKNYISQADKDLKRIERLRQHRRIHDGDTSAELLRAGGGVGDDFVRRMRSACRTCAFGQHGFRPRYMCGPSRSCSGLPLASSPTAPTPSSAEAAEAAEPPSGDGGERSGGDDEAPHCAPGLQGQSTGLPPNALLWSAAETTEECCPEKDGLGPCVARDCELVEAAIGPDPAEASCGGFFSTCHACNNGPPAASPGRSTLHL
mmetsp:Transcript_42121/g.119120  ORF Transcript_42121/g.119120 Transcript_42121/m.119120 type:complete len:288 (-) Transcript_42121:56-919(-)